MRGMVPLEEQEQEQELSHHYSDLVPGRFPQPLYPMTK
jgi:hypothetical protein